MFAQKERNTKIIFSSYIVTPFEVNQKGLFYIQEDNKHYKTVSQIHKLVIELTIKFELENGMVEGINSHFNPDTPDEFKLVVVDNYPQMSEKNTCALNFLSKNGGTKTQYSVILHTSDCDALLEAIQSYEQPLTVSTNQHSLFANDESLMKVEKDNVTAYLAI